MPYAPLAPGQILGQKYEVGEAIDSGGYAKIFVARRLEDDLSVVIKALLPGVEGTDPAAVERFNREAAIAAALDHPNVVKILDYGHTRQGLLYAVFERLYGYPLSDVIHREPMDPDEVQSILEQILRALDAAHSLGLIHRDIKPANVFFINAEDEDSPWANTAIKLLDFGFAKGTFGASKFMRRPLTMLGNRVGTPGYMAPEMLERNGIITVQSDLYAAGLLGYEMLTGKPAYEGKGLELALAQIESDPKLPPLALAALPLYFVIEKLLVRDRADRFATARQALDVLAEL